MADVLGDVPDVHVRGQKVVCALRAVSSVIFQVERVPMLDEDGGNAESEMHNAHKEVAKGSTAKGGAVLGLQIRLGKLGRHGALLDWFGWGPGLGVLGAYAQRDDRIHADPTALPYSPLDGILERVEKKVAKMGCSSELEGVNEDDHQARYAHCGLETAKRPQLEHHPESKPLRDRVFDGLELLVCSFLGHAHKCRVEGENLPPAPQQALAGPHAQHLVGWR